MDALFDIEPAGRTDAGSPIRFRVVARSSDPVTSHEAAASVSVRDVTRTHELILSILSAYGWLTDEQIAQAYTRLIESQGAKPVSPSGLRSRRAELVALGKVKDSGQRGRTASGRASTRWALA